MLFIYKPISVSILQKQLKVRKRPIHDSQLQKKELFSGRNSKYRHKYFSQLSDEQTNHLSLNVCKI